MFYLFDWKFPDLKSFSKQNVLTQKFGHTSMAFPARALPIGIGRAIGPSLSLSATKIFVVCTCFKLVSFSIPLLYLPCWFLNLIDDRLWIIIFSTKVVFFSCRWKRVTSFKIKKPNSFNVFILFKTFFTVDFHMVKGALGGLRQFLATESPLKVMKNNFYFTSKALFVLKIFNVFSPIWTEYRDLQSKSPYSVWKRENTAQKNSK